MEIVRAIEILKLRGFEIEDYSQVKYRVTDEELDELINTDEELIRFAKDQEEYIENEYCNSCAKALYENDKENLCKECIKQNKNEK